MHRGGYKVISTTDSGEKVHAAARRVEGPQGVLHELKATFYSWGGGGGGRKDMLI